MAQDQTNEFNYVKLHTAGSRVRTIANLLIAHDPDAGVSTDFSLWPELGDMLDELGCEVVRISTEIEMESIQKINKAQLKRR
jgi:hypothetical protein